MSRKESTVGMGPHAPWSWSNSLFCPKFQDQGLGLQVCPCEVREQGDNGNHKEQARTAPASPLQASVLAAALEVCPQEEGLSQTCSGCLHDPPQ